MIRMEEVSHRYGDGTQGLDAVSLEVAAREVVALTGPTGSGKSTLIRHLNGLLRPSSGRVLISEEDIRDQRVAQLARRVGIAFQEPDHQLFCRTVRAEIAFGAHDSQAVEEALNLTGLIAVAERHPHDLGYSRRKLVAIAAVIAMSTPVVVLDEPTTGQDPAGVTRLDALVTWLRERGSTLMVVSHDTSFVSRSCDREHRLLAGRLVR